jgi:hypothetical protein
MEYTDLTEAQKLQYKDYCDNKYGFTCTFDGDTREPLYFDEDGDMVDTAIVLDLLFNINQN